MIKITGYFLQHITVAVQPVTLFSRHSRLIIFRFLSTHYHSGLPYPVNFAATMKYFFPLLFILFAHTAGAQNIPAYSAEKLMQRLRNKDTTYIVNFWATWCGPCVKELPQFDKLQRMYAGKPVKVIMASFDFKESYPDKLATYIKRKNLLPEVVWWSETNANEFIPKIDNNWSGGLPATMVVNAGSKYQRFIERPVTAEEIAAMVSQATKN